MSKLIHTPGPWFFEVEYGSDGDSAVIDVRSDTFHVATIHEHVDRGDDSNTNLQVDIANAQLLAASPDLLAVLQRYIAADEKRQAGRKGPVSQLLFDAQAAVVRATSYGRGGK